MDGHDVESDAGAGNAGDLADGRAGALVIAADELFDVGAARCTDLPDRFPALAVHETRVDDLFAA